VAFGEHRPQKDLQVSFNNKRKHSRSGITPETTFGSRVFERPTPYEVVEILLD